MQTCLTLWKVNNSWELVFPLLTRPKYTFSLTHPQEAKNTRDFDLLSDPSYFVDLLEPCICYSIIYVYICTYNVKNTNRVKNRGRRNVYYLKICEEMRNLKLIRNTRPQWDTILHTTDGKKLSSLVIPSVCAGVDQLDFLFVAGRNINGFHYFGE